MILFYADNDYLNVFLGSRKNPTTHGFFYNLFLDEKKPNPRDLRLFWRENSKKLRWRKSIVSFLPTPHYAEQDSQVISQAGLFLDDGVTVNFVAVAPGRV